MTEVHPPWSGPAPATRSLADLGDDLVRLAEITGAPRPRAVYDELEARWGKVAPVAIDDDAPGWLVLGYGEATQVLRNESLYSADGGRWNGHARTQHGRGSFLNTYLPVGGRLSVNHQDGAVHRRLRTPIDDAVAAYDETRISKQVRQQCDLLLDRLASRGRADLVDEYAAPIPILATTGLLGFEPDVGAQLMSLVGRIVGGDDPQAAGQQLSGLIGEQIGARMRAPADDIASILVHHPSYDGMAEIADALIVFAGAAGEHLLSWISQTLLLLLGGSPLSSRVRHGVLSLDEALDLVLWNESPAAHVLPRIATQEHELGNRLVREGDAVVVAIHAVNTDLALQTDDLWDQVGNRAHLSFGAGPHACPAPRIARIVARTTVEAALQRLRPRLAVAADDVEWTSSITNRRPAHLPVTFEPEQD